jgi:hypothetical protein
VPITVNLDPIAQAIDQALAHPMARAVESALPGATARVRAIRENLPEVAAGLEQRGLEAVGRSLDEVLVGAIENWLAPKKKRPRAKKQPKRLGKGKR